MWHNIETASIDDGEAEDQTEDKGKDEDEDLVLDGRNDLIAVLAVFPGTLQTCGGAAGLGWAWNWASARRETSARDSTPMNF